MNHILVIDTGTSSMRGLLFDRFGKIMNISQKPYFMNIDGDKAVQPVSDFSGALVAICRDTVAYCTENNIQVSTMSFTSQRSSVIPVDHDGTPLADAMMWYDKRSQAICNKANEEAGAMIYETCGMKASPVFSAPKMAWIKQNHSDIYDKTYKMAGIQDYLIYLCTGDFVTDSSLASRTCLLNITTKSWSDELISLYGIDKDKLCRMIPTGSIAGLTTGSFAALTGITSGIPVVSAGGDQQCSALGQMLTEANQVGITSGTASYVVAISDRPVSDQKSRINVNISARPDQWILEASNMASGSVYEWLRKTFYGPETSIEIVNQDVISAGPLANGLIMLPDLAGKGCPQWDSYARGIFVNVGFGHERKDFARAALEGIAAEITECYQVLQECLGRFNQVTSTGGLSKFPEFNQILADMMNVPVQRCPVEETTGIGAWANAAVATGIYDTVKDAFAGMRDDISQPLIIPDAKRHQAYQRQSEIRASLRASFDNKDLHDQIEAMK